MQESQETTIETLSSKTAVQLRSLCKDLGLTGISKFNKAQLVQRILDSAPTNSQPTAQNGDRAATAAGDGHSLPSATQDASTTPQTTDSTATASSSLPVSSTKKRKSSSASTKQRGRKKSKGAAKEDEEDGITAATPPKPPADQHGTPYSSTTAKRVSLNDIPRPKPAFNERMGATRRHTSSATLTTDRPAAKAAIPAGTSTPGSTSSSSLLSQPPPPPPAVPRARKIQTQVPPGRLAIRQRFVPPKAIDKVASRNPTGEAAVATLHHPLVPLATGPIPAASMRTNRISHVSSHFVNRLFANLDAGRTFPDSDPARANAVGGIPSLAFTGFHEDIYSTSNEDLQVALRWWIWRMHTALQLGSGEAWSAQGGGLGLLGPDMTTWPPVVACKQVATGIFCITTLEPPRLPILPADVQTDSKTASKKAPKASRRAKSNRKSSASSAPTEPVMPLTELIAVKYLTIGITGEVIACSRRNMLPESGHDYPEQLLIEGCPVRPDWHAFLAARKLPTPPESPTPQPLITLVKTKDANDAPHGISKAWRTRAETANEANGASDPETMDVAARVVLASCALNSFSGEKLSMMQMDAEWLGNGVVLDHSARQRVELYLPEPLQILSVHLPPPPCHPSIAIAHRSSGRSDYVLRETGQVIGDEDGGVVELWQGILGCDYKGAEKDMGDFWKGWQDRIIDNEEE